MSATAATFTARLDGAPKTAHELPPLEIPPTVSADVHRAMGFKYEQDVYDMASELETARAWFRRYPELVTAADVPQWAVQAI